MKKKNYPLYETTVFENFRIMTENVANKYPDRVAFSFKEDPKSDTVIEKTFTQTRSEIRGFGTACVELGCREKHHKCSILSHLPTRRLSSCPF